MQMQSRIHRRWMGSHTLIGLTLLTDLIGMGLTYLTGGFLLPVLGTVGVWLFLVVLVLIEHLTEALHPDLALYIILGVGALVGLLLALGIGGLFDGPYTVHRGNIGKGIFAFLFAMLVAFLLWVIIAEFLHSSPILWPPRPSFTLTLNSWWATIWLLYYVGMHGIYALSASGQSVTMRGQCLYRYQLVSLSSPNTTASTVPQEQRLVLTDRDATMVPAFDTTRRTQMGTHRKLLRAVP